MFRSQGLPFMCYVLCALSQITGTLTSNIFLLVMDCLQVNNCECCFHIGSPGVWSCGSWFGDLRMPGSWLLEFSWPFPLVLRNL